MTDDEIRAKCERRGDFFGTALDGDRDLTESERQSLGQINDDLAVRVPGLLERAQAAEARVKRLEEALTIATDTALIASRAYRAALQEGKT